MKVVIAGGSGLIGQALAARLLDQGHAAVVLTRGANVAVGRAVRWDGTHLGDWCAELSDADALVNFAGPLQTKSEEEKESILQDHMATETGYRIARRIFITDTESHRRCLKGHRPAILP